MWHKPALEAYGIDANVRITSSWHETDTLPETDSDKDPDACLIAWARDLSEIRVSDFLLAYAEYKDRPNGTLFEVGYASSFETPVLLVGNFEWGTWKFLPNVTQHPTLQQAFAVIAGVKPNDQT
jgi:nucleoside 2-deoxyribosyltransferase